MRPGAALIGAVALALTAGATARACPDDRPRTATRAQIRFDSAGHSIEALLYRPAGLANGAAVVLLHGARGLSSDARTFDPHAIQLAARGYSVLVPDYYDARPGVQNRSSSDLRVWRHVGLDGVRYLGGLDGVDPARVALWGYSLGGFLAVDEGVEDAPIAAAVGVAAGTDVAEPGRGRRPIPVLLIHAEHDPVVSAASTRSLGAILSRRGVPVEIRSLPFDGHGYDQPTWCAAFALTRDFLDRVLTVPAA